MAAKCRFLARKYINLYNARHGYFGRKGLEADVELDMPSDRLGREADIRTLVRDALVETKKQA